MKQDMREISYNIKRSKEDKDLIYAIDYLLYNEIQDRYNRYTMEHHRNIDKMYYDVLNDKNGIVDYVVKEILKDYYEIDNFKINYLVDSRFMLNANKVKRYYVAANKSKKLVEDTELRAILRAYFGDCFYNCDETDAEGILRAMSTQTFKNAVIEDLKIDTSLDLYKDFDKIYKQELTDFKKLHKDEVLTSSKKPKKSGGLAFGWKLYAIVKIIETLFKL